MGTPLIIKTANGLYCPPAKVYLDPWRRVDRAIITHAHSDHAIRGHNHYLANELSVPLLRHRLDSNINISGLPFGQIVDINGVKVSLHPAGHISGSAQVRLEYCGEVWVYGGDYKVNYDGFTQQFEPIKCDTFITESTFGLPIFSWPTEAQVEAQILAWWQSNKEHGLTSLLLGYSLGKAQRLTKLVANGDGNVWLHPTVWEINQILIQHGVSLPLFPKFPESLSAIGVQHPLLIASQQFLQSPQLRELGPVSIGMASGWMQVGKLRLQGLTDVGFVVSDHADWAELNSAIKATAAQQVLVTHGFTHEFADWLNSQGIAAQSLDAKFSGTEDVAIG